MRWYVVDPFQEKDQAAPKAALWDRNFTTLKVPIRKKDLLVPASGNIL